jgi:hypothetical protein
VTDQQEQQQEHHSRLNIPTNSLVNQRRSAAVEQLRSAISQLGGYPQTRGGQGFEREAALGENGGAGAQGGLTECLGGKAEETVKGVGGQREDQDKSLTVLDTKKNNLTRSSETKKKHEALITQPVGKPDRPVPSLNHKAGELEATSIHVRGVKRSLTDLGLRGSESFECMASGGKGERERKGKGWGGGDLDESEGGVVSHRRRRTMSDVTSDCTDALLSEVSSSHVSQVTQRGCD